MSDSATASRAGILLDEFVKLTETKRDLERDLRMVKEQLKPIEADLLEEFADRGVSGERHAATGKLVSITRRIWARAKGPKAEACDAMARDPELAPFVEQSFNTNSVSAYFRELAAARNDAGDPVTDLSSLVPEELRNLLELTEDHVLSVRS